MLGAHLAFFGEERNFSQFRVAEKIIINSRAPGATNSNNISSLCSLLGDIRTVS